MRRGKPMRRQSVKRAQQERDYWPARKAFLAEHPVCQFPSGCTDKATTIQHRRGRAGKRLLDETWWAASCWAHNTWAEENTGEALEIGWLVRVESNLTGEPSSIDAGGIR